MTKIILFWTTLFSFISGILYWRNIKKYKKRSKYWNFCKAISETFVLFLTAIFIPGLLIGWCITWIISPIKKIRLKIIFGIVISILLNCISTIAVELLIIIGIFSIDLKFKSILTCYKRAKTEENKKNIKGS
jgi:hypothetical protein